VRSQITEQDKDAVAAAIGDAERKTSGEIVFAVTERAGRYRHISYLTGIGGLLMASAVYLALPLPHTIPGLLWTQLIGYLGAFSLSFQRPLQRFLIPDKEMDARVGEAAFEEFYASGLHRTREQNGVLIYLSLLEQRVVVLGDRGIHEKMGDRHWKEVRDRILKGIRQGDAGKGICEAVRLCGEALATHFPPRPDDVNELSDAVLDRRGQARAPE